MSRWVVVWGAPMPKQPFLIWLWIKPPPSLSALVICSLSQRWLLPRAEQGLSLGGWPWRQIATSHLMIAALPGSLSPLSNPLPPMAQLPQVLPSIWSFPLGLLYPIRVVSWVWLWTKNMPSLFFLFLQNMQLSKIHIKDTYIKEHFLKITLWFNLVTFSPLPVRAQGECEMYESIFPVWVRGGWFLPTRNKRSWKKILEKRIALPENIQRSIQGAQM